MLRLQQIFTGALDLDTLEGNIFSFYIPSILIIFWNGKELVVWID